MEVLFFFCKLQNFLKILSFHILVHILRYFVCCMVFKHNFGLCQQYHYRYWRLFNKQILLKDYWLNALAWKPLKRHYRTFSTTLSTKAKMTSNDHTAYQVPIFQKKARLFLKWWCKKVYCFQAEGNLGK